MEEIYFETYGCSANKNSTEIMKGLVKQAGLNITENPEFADIIIINSCIVKQPTEEKIRRRIQDLLDSNKKTKIILAGCMPRLNKEKFSSQKNIFLLDTSHVKDLIPLIQDIKENNYSSEKYLQHRNEVKASLPKISDKKFIGITQISEGCLGECSYCIVKLAKGKLFSYPREKIIESVKRDLESGCKEIWLTSQDCASYGNEEGKYLLPELLKEILELKGKFYLRLGMVNPNNLLPILPEMIEIFKNKKMFKFLHIPIQSGSDAVLKKMKRKYSTKDVMKIINELKKQIPEITISTDIIIGFPTETEKDWNETILLIKEIKPLILNRSNFYPRQGTKAEKLQQLVPEIINKRSIEISKLHLEICKELQNNFANLNTEHEVIVDEIGFPGTYLARNENYRLFAIPSKEKLLGKIINVKIKKITPHYLIASKT